MQSSYPNVALTSFNNEIMVTQSGDENESTVTFSNILDSNNSSVDIAQSGDLNSLDMMIEGSGHNIDIAQTGNYNMIGGIGGDAMLVGGGDVMLSINQIGDGNLVEGSIISASGSIAITQVGDFNSATIVQQ